MENKKVSIQELVDLISSQTDFTKKFTEEFIRELIQVVEEYLEKDGIVKVKGLGTFKLIWNEERKSVNVTTKQSIILPAHYKVTFVPEKMVKDAVNAPYTHLETTFVAEQATQEATSTEVLNNTTPSSEEVTTKEVLPQLDQEGLAPEGLVSHLAQAPAPNQNSESNSEQTLKPAQDSSLTTETPEQDLPQSSASKESPVKRRLNRLFLHLVIIFGLLMAVCYYFCYSHPSILNEIFNKQAIVVEDVEIEPVSTSEQAVEVYVDELSLEKDDLFADEDDLFEEQENNIEEQEQEYTPTVAQEAPVRELVTVIDGSRLTMISYRAFGHKAFWVYVYDANRDVLSSSGDVEKGMKLKIPDLDEDLVDPKSSECLTRAYSLAKQRSYR